MITGAVLPYWPDRPPEEALAVAQAGDELGFRELWIGEMATYDAFALATAIAGVTTRIPLTIGPLAVHVRTPTTIALGVASVAALMSRPVAVALGTSSNVVVEQWHARSRTDVANTLAATAVEVARLLRGDKGTRGFRLRLPPVDASLTVAAFGRAAVEIAARHGDRMVINLVTPASAASLREQLDDAARRAGRAAPPIVMWLPAAIDPEADAYSQLAGALIAYLAAPGYADQFRAAGFDEVVDFAFTRPHPRDLLARTPAELIDCVSLIGSADHIARRVGEYRNAGVSEIAIVPVTAGDPAGRRTLKALAPLAPSA